MSSKAQMPRTCACPACEAGYYLNQSSIGRRTACQKCGQRFHLLPGSDLAPTELIQPPDRFSSLWPLVGRMWLDLRPGQIVAQRYLVIRPLGQGGISQVFQVLDLDRNLDLALKLPLPGTIDRLPSIVFVNEAVAWLKPAPHPNLVTCDHVIVMMKQPVIFMEYIQGCDLSRLMDEGDGDLYNGDQAEWPGRLLDIFIQMTRGLIFAHSVGLTRLDIKPRNVLVEDSGRVLIGDYGPLSDPEAVEPGLPRKELDDGGDSTGGDTRFTHSRLLGTPQYFSPETAAGLTEAGTSADLWALTLTALECFIGHRPWEMGSVAGKALDQYLAEKAKVPVPLPMIAFFKKALAENLGDRYQTAVEMEKVLLMIYRQVVGHPYQRQPAMAVRETPDRLNNKAVSFMELGRTWEAADLWRQALTLDPKHQLALYNQSLAAAWERRFAPDVTRPPAPKWWLGRRLTPMRDREESLPARRDTPEE